MALAIAEASSPEFDRAVGLIVDRPTPAPTDPAIAAFFARHDFKTPIRRVTFGLRKRWDCDFAVCEDAVQEAFLTLYEYDRRLFLKPPDAWMKLVYRVAYRELIKARKEARRTGSIDRMVDESGDAAFRGARPATPISVEDVNEDARYLAPPRPGEAWERLQMLGAAQRFRDANGRPPTSDECKSRWRELGLPPASRILKEFKSFNGFILEAGMTPRFTARTRQWDAVTAARDCVSWRWRNSHWPGRPELENPSNELPGIQTCERYFGGCRSIDIQLGVEAILTADEIAGRW